MLNKTGDEGDTSVTNNELSNISGVQEDAGPTQPLLKKEDENKPTFYAKMVLLLIVSI